jgi:DNA-binding transcriptional MerR regulator
MFHTGTISLEPNFKSSKDVEIAEQDDLSIGDAAALLGVATSTLRYYERRGLAVADGRRSGQRRYRQATIRRLVFVQMLQDAGLTLDEIEAILGAENNESWKEIAAGRLVQLDAEIVGLQRSRELLAASLLCRFDHPLDECHVMNGEIDRRLTTNQTIDE